MFCMSYTLSIHSADVDLGFLGFWCCEHLWICVCLSPPFEFLGTDLEDHENATCNC